MEFPASVGLHDIETRLADGRTVRYSVAVPATMPPDGRRPLVLVLHYAGTPTRFYGRPLLEYLFAPALAPLAAVCIAPESMRGQWHAEDNEAFVMALLDEAIAAYGIDPARVVVGGYSMGAIGTWHFIEHYPERFSAALPVAGYPSGDFDCPCPVHAFHSDADELFALAPLRQQVATLASRGRPITLTTAEVNGHYDVNGYRAALDVVPAWLAAVWHNGSG
jgi:predicted peptidase